MRGSQAVECHVGKRERREREKERGGVQSKSFPQRVAEGVGAELPTSSGHRVSISF